MIMKNLIIITIKFQVNNLLKFYLSINTLENSLLRKSQRKKKEYDYNELNDGCLQPKQLKAACNFIHFFRSEKISQDNIVYIMEVNFIYTKKIIYIFFLDRL